MKKIFVVIATLISSLVSYAQNTITKNVIVDAPGWKRVAKFSGSAGRGYNEITILTKGGAVAPTVSKISWFKGYSDYGGIHTETLSRVRYWSQARITFDGTNGFLEINFTKEIPSLTIHLNRAAWTGGTIFEGTLPNGGGDVVTGTITNFGRFNIASNKLFVNNGNGHVGIGTVTPSALLEIKSGKDKNSELHLNTTTKDKVSVLRFQDEGKSSWGFLSNYPHNEKFTLYNYQNTAKSFALTLDKESNIGIGTHTPLQKLDVRGITQLGEKQATSGGVFLAQHYAGNDYISTFSSNYASGGLILGYGAAGMKGQGHNKLVSTLDNFSSNRGALRFGKGTLEFLGTSSPTQANVNELLTMKSRFFIKEDGNIGIGTNNPKTSLQVHNGTLKVTGGSALGQESARLVVDAGPSTGHSLIELRNNNGVVLRASGSGIGIGSTTIPSGYKLAVAGKVISEEVKIQLKANWPDFVFKKEYNLPTLTEVENHIKEKGHLENIPSAKEVKKDGFFLGEMDAKLLQKVEELTLYTIQQEKELQSQKTQIRKQENEILELKKQNIEIEKLKILVNQLIDSKK